MKIHLNNDVIQLAKYVLFGERTISRIFALIPPIEQCETTTMTYYVINPFHPSEIEVNGPYDFRDKYTYMTREYLIRKTIKIVDNSYNREQIENLPTQLQNLVTWIP